MKRRIIQLHTNALGYLIGLCNDGATFLWDQGRWEPFLSDVPQDGFDPVNTIDAQLSNVAACVSQLVRSIEAKEPAPEQDAPGKKPGSLYYYLAANPLRRAKGESLFYRVIDGCIQCRFIHDGWSTSGLSIIDLHEGAEKGLFTIISDATTVDGLGGGQ